MASALLHQRCVQHPSREAAARCPDCRRFFCRECATEHDGRLLCASCLVKASRPAEKVRRNPWFSHTLSVSAGIATSCLFFYLLAGLLNLMPDSFQQGTRWQKSWLNSDHGNSSP